MLNRGFVLAALLLLTLMVYFFVSTPAPLPDSSEVCGITYPIADAFHILNTANVAVRQLWTEEIVGPGKKAGLAFSEDWREVGVNAGPLPALFLRAIAASLERSPVRLGLYLGSDFPIRAENRFDGAQLEKFYKIRNNRQAQFFFATDIQVHVAMFPDVAVSKPCVSCHNTHLNSPKTNWEIGDIMGAVTWMYPASEVSADDLLTLLKAFGQGVRDAYTAYLEKTTTFTNPPPLGQSWPRDGYGLPSVEVFMAEATRRMSPDMLTKMVALPGNQNRRNSIRTSTAQGERPRM